MRKILQITFGISLFLLTVIQESVSKGREGVYLIKGTAYSINKEVLRNESLFVRYGSRYVIVITDDDGKFEIKIHWANACSSGRSKVQQKKENKQLNPEFISISLNDHEIILKNKWQKYAKTNNKTREKDLVFKNYINT
ncbi:MAG: hypothetical protein ACK40G_14425 [Cytophagaceae bacterium]